MEYVDGRRLPEASGLRDIAEPSAWTRYTSRVDDPLFRESFVDPDLERLDLLRGERRVRRRWHALGADLGKHHARIELHIFVLGEIQAPRHGCAELAEERGDVFLKRNRGHGVLLHEAGGDFPDAAT